MKDVNPKQRGSVFIAPLFTSREAFERVRSACPPGVGIRVQVKGDINNLVFDGQRFAALDRDINLENSTFKSAISRCDICIASGADHLTIEE